ncbi:MAG TPA: methyltransferase domain-containing protein, partial [Chthonomonadaceae bacterium]|nr:methyltransferase domain-containing protein [Chthonomonadaceae bacterium]
VKENSQPPKTPPKSIRPSKITLDLFGGEKSQIPGAINVDLNAKAQPGVAADVTRLPFANNSVDEIVASGPRAPFIEEAARVLKPGGRIYMNGTHSNRFFRLFVTASNQPMSDQELANLGLRIIQKEGPLDPKFKDLTFYREDYTSQIDKTFMRTTILEKY